MSWDALSIVLFEEAVATLTVSCANGTAGCWPVIVQELASVFGETCAETLFVVFVFRAVTN